MTSTVTDLVTDSIFARRAPPLVVIRLLLSTALNDSAAAAAGDNVIILTVRLPLEIRVKASEGVHG